MQHLEVSCAVRRFFKSLGFKGLMLSRCGCCRRLSLRAQPKNPLLQKKCKVKKDITFKIQDSIMCMCLNAS